MPDRSRMNSPWVVLIAALSWIVGERSKWANQS